MNKENKQVSKENVYILNGYPRSGKDTVAELLREEGIDAKVFSTVDTSKELYRICGWDGEKRLQDRKILSDIKDFLNAKFDASFTEIKAVIAEFVKDESADSSALFIMAREPEEIERVKREFPFVKTVLVDATKRIGVPETSNHADENVLKVKYDIVLDNNGSLDDFRRSIIDGLGFGTMDS